MQNKISVRILFLFMGCFLLQACDTTNYYYMLKDGKEVTSSMLYKDKSLMLFLRVYNGNISRLTISTPMESGISKIEVIKFEHSLLANEVSYDSSIIGDFGLGVVKFLDNGSATITSKIVFDDPPELLSESILIELLVEGRIVTISKKFHLLKGSYNQFEALMNL